MAGKWLLPVRPLLAFSKFTHRRYLSIVPPHLYGFQFKFSGLWDCENTSSVPTQTLNFKRWKLAESEKEIADTRMGCCWKIEFQLDYGMDKLLDLRLSS